MAIQFPKLLYLTFWEIILDLGIGYCKKIQFFHLKGLRTFHNVDLNHELPFNSTYWKRVVLKVFNGLKLNSIKFKRKLR